MEILIITLQPLLPIHTHIQGLSTVSSIWYNTSQPQCYLLLSSEIYSCLHCPGVILTFLRPRRVVIHVSTRVSLLMGGGNVLVGVIYNYYAGMLVSMLQYYMLSAMVMETNEMEGASYLVLLGEQL